MSVLLPEHAWASAGVNRDLETGMACMFDRPQLLAILAGAAGGTMAIGGMEAFSIWGGISALRNSIRDVDRNSIGLTKGRAGATSGPCRRSPPLYARWTAGCETVRSSAVGCRRRCWFGNGRNASDRHVSPACRHRSASCCRQQHVLELSDCASRHRCPAARNICFCLEQFRRARR